jgi:hypothetical protein
MFTFFMILALVFLIAGGAGLFYVNVNVASGTPLWMVGNIAFGVFAIVGLMILIFMAIFNTEFDR